MTEFELLGPLAYSKPCAQAVLKASPEDFQVDEVLDIPLSGAGEHLWLWVEKRQLNTEEAARRLARAAGISAKSVSFAGLKDRQALTRQWFSLHLPGKADPDLRGAEDDSLRILNAVRHSRKLQRGAHSANGFTLRLTQCTAPAAWMDARCTLLQQQGVPNYFGMQRFGFEGNNLAEAIHWAEQGSVPEQRTRRARVLSAARSYLFNRLLAQRVAEGSWNQVRAGDLLSFTDSHSFFAATEADCQDPRLAALELHPTGPLWGEGLPSSLGETLQQELDYGLHTHSSLIQWLAGVGMTQERRILRLPIRNLSWHYPQPDLLQLSFVLPAGCFATVVVRELVNLVEPMDITCAF